MLLLLYNKPLLRSLVQVPREHEVDRDTKGREDNAPDPNPPSPADMGQELLGSLGSSKGRDQSRRRGKGKGQPSVSQAGHIRREHIVTEAETAKTHLVEDLSGAVGRQVLGHR